MDSKLESSSSELPAEEETMEANAQNSTLVEESAVRHQQHDSDGNTSEPSKSKEANSVQGCVEATVINTDEEASETTLRGNNLTEKVVKKQNSSTDGSLGDDQDLHSKVQNAGAKENYLMKKPSAMSEHPDLNNENNEDQHTSNNNKTKVPMDTCHNNDILNGTDELEGLYTRVEDSVQSKFQEPNQQNFNSFSNGCPRFGVEDIAEQILPDHSVLHKPILAGK